jgi:hypothetical protein
MTQLKTIKQRKRILSYVTFDSSQAPTDFVKISHTVESNVLDLPKPPI